VLPLPRKSPWLPRLFSINHSRKDNGISAHQGEHRGRPRLLLPAWNKNGTLRPGFAKGKHEPFAEFTYYVRWTEGGKRKTQCVGKDATVAIAAVREKDRWRASGVAASAPVAAQPQDGRRTIASVTADWLLWAKAHKDADTYGSYKRSAELFHEFLAERSAVTMLDQVTEGLILDYKLWLERQGYAEATLWKFLNQIHGCLRRAKHFAWISEDDMPKKDDGHRYAE
jgi:Phage integrase SAM-like domain